jgi:hypothetical protein
LAIGRPLLAAQLNQDNGEVRGKAKSMLGRDTSLRAIGLAALISALLAPFLTGVVLGSPYKGIWGALFGGPLAFLVALSQMPLLIFGVWLAMVMCGCLACECARWAFPVVVLGTSVIGGCAVLFGMQVIQRVNEPGTLPYVGAFLLAGALTGTIYGGLIVICDRWIKA